MTSDAPVFGKGVRLRRGPDGSPLLLVPEGALALNESAAATLELVDGQRTAAEIAALLAERFAVTPEQAGEDVAALFARLRERRFIVLRQAQDDTNSSAPARSAVLSEARSAQSKGQDDTEWRAPTAIAISTTSSSLSESPRIALS